MNLNKILEGLEIKETVNNLNLDITNIHSDSRKIKQNGLFVAINGYLQKGIDYLDSAIENGANFLIRGIRNGMDYDYEENIALINEELAGIDTIYVRSGKYGAISSSMIVEFLNYGKDVSNLIPQEIYDVIK